MSPSTETDRAVSPQSPDADDLRFQFGTNWADYVRRHFSDERVDIARRHLLAVLKLDDLKGRTFLDIGCGSGLHSLAALRAGAERIVSFDYDRNSVATTMKLRQMSGAPERWSAMQGSVLDRAFVDQLPKSDIVYSWGVLHHTGSMWNAIENASRCLHDTSVFYIALYSTDVYTNPPASYWLDVKREYNRANILKKRWMDWKYAWNNSIRNDLRNRKNPLATVREYQKSRGMSVLARRAGLAGRLSDGVRRSRRDVAILPRPAGAGAVARPRRRSQYRIRVSTHGRLELLGRSPRIIAVGRPPGPVRARPGVFVACEAAAGIV